MMNDNPLVSIIIPVYNGANYMKEAIDSALNQTYENIEVLVINDGSKDNGETEKIALSYGDKIRYFHKENGGVSSALNLGIREMKGEYFSWLSHDDVYFPEKVSSQIDVLEKYGDANTVCYCNSIHINKDSKKISKRKSRYTFTCGQITDCKQVLLNLFKYGSFNGCALLIPKNIFTDNDLYFDESMRYSQDLLMWYRIFLKGYSLIYTDYVGVKNRIHDKQLTQTGKALFKKDSLTIGDILLDEIIEKSDKTNKFIYYFLRNNAIYNNTGVVRKGLKKVKGKKKLSLSQRISLKWYVFYGGIRPAIRRTYYRIFRKVKTN